MSTDARTLLLLDDDDVFATRMAKALGARGFEVVRAATAAEALARAREESPECALGDLRLPDAHGRADAAGGLKLRRRTGMSWPSVNP